MSTALVELQPRSVATRPAPSLRAVLLWTNGIALLAVAVFLRVWHLGNIPGLNGDEAWYGVQALRVLHGESISWRTPTGNPINPFFFLPQVALHAMLPASVVLLRSVAVISGLAALPVNYILCRRAFDRSTAIVSTVLLALLPVNIAYSRFAWDASQSLLATLFVVYLPLARLRAGDGRSLLSGAAVLACVAAVVIHPTNVFAAVFLFVPLAYARRREILNFLRKSKVHAQPWVLATLAVGLAATAWLALYLAPQLGERLHGPRALLPFAVNYLRLFSGSAVYQYISGAGLHTSNAGWFERTTLACDLGFGLVALLALLGLARRVARNATPVDTCLMIGWLAMLAAFFVIAGPESIAPHFERYGICLIAPGTLLIARGLAWWIDGCEACGRRLGIALALAAWLWPASFGVNYLQCFISTGGLSHKAFRTAAVEPKITALNDILSARVAGRPVDIVCREWWSYWPLAYLAFDVPQTRVLTWDEWASTRRAKPAVDDDTWFVEFAGSPGEIDSFQTAHARSTYVQWYTVLDYGERPLISVFGPLENSSQNY
ncbi:MAG: ArnT family glycosyltransferase [Pirellulales bacterium]